jgi:hypothetical protein
MNKKTQPIGWVTTLSTLKSEASLMYSSLMTIENSPLRKLDPRVAHMVFQILAFIWSGIFAVMIGSYMIFGVSAILHMAFITGIFITALTMNEADKRPQTFDRFKARDNVINSRGAGGEHE